MPSLLATIEGAWRFAALNSRGANTLYILLIMNDFCLIHNKFKVGDKVEAFGAEGYTGVIEKILPKATSALPYSVRWTNIVTGQVLDTIYYYSEQALKLLKYEQ